MRAWNSRARVLLMRVVIVAVYPRTHRVARSDVRAHLDQHHRDGRELTKTGAVQRGGLESLVLVDVDNDGNDMSHGVEVTTLIRRHEQRSRCVRVEFAPANDDNREALGSWSWLVEQLLCHWTWCLYTFDGWLHFVCGCCVLCTVILAKCLIVNLSAILLSARSSLSVN